MTTMTSGILSIANFAGIVAFAFDGAIQARKMHATRLLALLCGVINAFGGGFLFRDCLLLRVTPSALFAGEEQLLALMAAYIGLVVYDTPLFNTAIKCPMIKLLLWVMDSLGIAAFAVAGVERACAFHSSFPIVIFCGFVSCVGGGFIRMLLTMDCFWDAVLALPYYRFFAFQTVMIYIIHRSSFDAVSYTILIALLGVIINSEARQTLSSIYRKAIVVISLSDPSIMLYHSIIYHPTVQFNTIRER